MKKAAVEKPIWEQSESRLLSRCSVPTDFVGLADDLPQPAVTDPILADVAGEDELSEARARVDEALNTLPLEEYMAVSLRHLAEWNIDEVARRLKCSPEKVADLTEMGMAKLRFLLT